jgi:hypothetical protein
MIVWLWKLALLETLRAVRDYAACKTDFLTRSEGCPKVVVALLAVG